MSRKIPVSTVAERRAWLQIAQDFRAGEYRNASDSLKGSIAIGVSFYAADPEFRKLFRLPALRKEGADEGVRETFKKLITGK